MPIGKNSIKRVQNGGYSKVKTAAPDMQNSTVLSNPSPEVLEVFVTSKEEKNAKKSKEKVTKQPKTAKKPENNAKKATDKKVEAPTKKSAKATTSNKEIKKASEPKSESARKVVSAAEIKHEPSYINLGKPLPTHLL